MVVVEHSRSTYQVQDLITQHIHTVHVSRLKPFNAAQTEDLIAVAAVDSAEYIVESIVEHRSAANKRDWTFRVRWEGYSPEEDSWISYAEASELYAFHAYRHAHPELQL